MSQVFTAASSAPAGVSSRVPTIAWEGGGDHSAVMARRMGSSGDIGKHARERPGPFVDEDANGFFVIHAPLRAADAGIALANEIHGMIEGLAADPLRSLPDRKEDRHRMTASRAIARRAQPGLIGFLEEDRMHTALGRVEPMDTYESRVGRVTAADVHAAIKAWLTRDKATTVVLTGKE